MAKNDIFFISLTFQSEGRISIRAEIKVQTFETLFVILTFKGFLNYLNLKQVTFF